MYNAKCSGVVNNAIYSPWLLWHNFLCLRLKLTVIHKMGVVSSIKTSVSVHKLELQSRHSWCCVYPRLPL